MFPATATKSGREGITIQEEEVRVNGKVAQLFEGRDCIIDGLVKIKHFEQLCHL
jgi:hypothetical protein